MLIDTHCHIHDPQYGFDAGAVLGRARRAGVERVVVIGTSVEDSRVACEFAGRYDRVYWTFGVHPEELVGVGVSGGSRGLVVWPKGSGGFEMGITREAVFGAFSRVDRGRLVAVGEIGLDYHYGRENRGQQIELFEVMLELARVEGLPVVFHVREAYEDFWPIVDNAGVKRAVVHSFSDSWENLEQALARGFYVGVNGLVTFASIPLPPLERMLLETDAPFLTPVPFRGKINEPGYVKNIAEWVADELRVSMSEVSEATTRNAKTLLNI